MSGGGTKTRTLNHVDGESPGAYVIAIDNTSSRTIELPVEGTLQVGRSKDAEIQISSEAVSRFHAKLVCSLGRILFGGRRGSGNH